jgi:kynurenine formamidase
MNVANKLKNSVKVIDLSHEIYNEMPGWPTHPVFRIYSLKNIEIDGYNIKEILMNTHHGTHLDLPVHMIKNGKKLEDYPIDKFIGEGVVINLSHKKAKEHITNNDLENFDIKENYIVMIYTGWSNKRGWNKDYLYLWPYLDVKGAEYLKEKKIKLVGIDTLSIGAFGGKTAAMDPIDTTSIIVHQILLGNDILILEEVANLNLVLNEKSQAKAFFVIAPLKIKEADGAPARVLAFLE